MTSEIRQSQVSGSIAVLQRRRFVARLVFALRISPPILKQNLRAAIMGILPNVPDCHKTRN